MLSSFSDDSDESVEDESAIVKRACKGHTDDVIYANDSSDVLFINKNHVISVPSKKHKQILETRFIGIITQNM